MLKREDLLPLVGNMCIPLICLAFNKKLNIKVGQGLVCKTSQDQSSPCGDRLAGSGLETVCACFITKC